MAERSQSFTPASDLGAWSGGLRGAEGESQGMGRPGEVGGELPRVQSPVIPPIQVP